MFVFEEVNGLKCYLVSNVLQNIDFFVFRKKVLEQHRGEKMTILIFLLN